MGWDWLQIMITAFVVVERDLLTLSFCGGLMVSLQGRRVCRKRVTSRYKSAADYRSVLRKSRL